MLEAILFRREVDASEVKLLWLGTVTDTLVQSARDTVQAFVQLLPNIPIVLMRQEQDRGVSQVIDSGKQFICHATLPRVNTICVCRRGLEIIQSAVCPQHGFCRRLEIVNPHIIRREQAQEVADGINSVKREKVLSAADSPEVWHYLKKRRLFVKS